MRIACYAKASKLDRKTLSAQMEEMKAYAKKRGWRIVAEVKEIGRDAKSYKKRQELINTAMRGEIDSIIVCRLDRWGRSIVDLIASLNSLCEIDVGFVSIKESLDLTSLPGPKPAQIFNTLANFELEVASINIKSGIAVARKKGGSHGRPITVANQKDQIERLFKKGISKSEIARMLNIGRTSVRRLLGS
jgi:putative DNA-invertase from lambdoid prophage Rac